MRLPGGYRLQGGQPAYMCLAWLRLLFLKTLAKVPVRDHEVTNPREQKHEREDDAVVPEPVRAWILKVTASAEQRGQHCDDHDSVHDRHEGQPAVLKGVWHRARSQVSMQRWATATGGERDEHEEAEDQNRERTGPQGPNRRLLALPLHSWRRAYGRSRDFAE